jgi:hypothetical protein
MRMFAAVRFWHKTDIPMLSADGRFCGVKWTLEIRPDISAFDPKRTLAWSRKGRFFDRPISGQ